MSQHDYDLANQAGSLFRSDLNSVLAAIVSQNSGASAPSTTYAYMFWVDTTTGWLKQRNSSNTAWIRVLMLSSVAPIWSPHEAKSGNYTILETDVGKLLRATASLTFALTAAATLGDGWWCDIRNDHTAAITIDPDGSEQVNGAATFSVPASHTVRLICTGSTFYTFAYSHAPGLIAFPAAQVASTDVNTLDDYEEGSFSPTVQDSSFSDGEGQSYSTNQGYYTKIGRLVHLDITIQMSSLGSLTSSDPTYVANLPFIIAALSFNQPSFSCGQASGLNLAAALAHISGIGQANQTRMILQHWNQTSGSQNLQISELSASGYIRLGGSYITTT